MEARIILPTAAQLIRKKGLDPHGDVQMFHTQNVLRRIKKYMPFVSGATYKITVAQTVISRPEIVTDTPYAKYLFYGKVWVDPKTHAAGFMTPEGWRSRKGCTKIITARNLTYNRSKNPAAGPRWDRALSAAEGPAMAADIERYMKQRR